MTNAEKEGYKAYPENKSYSTIGDTMYDYNAEKRRVYIAGYEKGYKDALDKAYAFIENIKSHDYDYLEDRGCEGIRWTSIRIAKLVKDLRKHMEEQQ